MRSPIMMLQAFGLGDIIFTQTLAKKLADGGEIIWPVQSQFFESVQDAYPGIHWIPEPFIKNEIMETKQARFELNGTRVFGVRFAEWLMGRQYVDHMKSKYELYGFDWRTWKADAIPKRFAFREQELLRFVGVADGEPFNLIATKFGSKAQHQTHIRVNNNFKNVMMDVVEWFTFFDWCAVIERAATIHAVSSSTLYLFEILDLAAKEIHLYPRKPIEQNFNYVKFLFTKPYILHD